MQLFAAFGSIGTKVAHHQAACVYRTNRITFDIETDKDEIELEMERYKVGDSECDYDVISNFI